MFFYKTVTYCYSSNTLAFRCDHLGGGVINTVFPYALICRTEFAAKKTQIFHLL